MPHSVDLMTGLALSFSEWSSISSYQVHCMHGSGPLFPFVGQFTLVPHLGPIRELAPCGQAGHRVLTGRGHKALGACGRGSFLVASPRTARVAGPGIHPYLLIAHHAPIRIEDLHMQEPVGRDFHIK